MTTPNQFTVSGWDEANARSKRQARRRAALHAIFESFDMPDIEGRFYAYIVDVKKGDAFPNEREWVEDEIISRCVEIDAEELWEKLGPDMMKEELLLEVLARKASNDEREIHSVCSDSTVAESKQKGV